MAINKKSKTTSNTPVVAFVNWGVVKKDGSIFKAQKGFPIWDNPEYVDLDQEMLVDLAKANGGSVELTMKVVVNLNTNSGESKRTLTLDDI